MTLDFSLFFRMVLFPFLFKILRFVGVVFLVLLVLGIYYTVQLFIRHRINLFHIDLDKLRKAPYKVKFFEFLKWAYIDLRTRKEKGREFEEFGLTAYVGKQGAGKTVSMIQYLHRMHKKYPECIIVTNFKFTLPGADIRKMKGWRDFFNIRNGTKGVIFAIDEIHSEWSSESWKDFPESLLSEISQQRKQRLKIVATSQKFNRVVKQLREQCFTVVECSTYLNRWTFCNEYEADEYDEFKSQLTTAKGTKLKRRWHWSFVQTDELRASYDTYEKIERLSHTEFIPRGERGTT